MALPPYASPLERAWYYTYLLICTAIFIFLIAPIIIIIPLSFNVEPYFSFTRKMLELDPSGYSLRWYDLLLTAGLNAPEDAVRDSSWWAQVWREATWVRAAKSSLWVGFWSMLLATVLGTIAALGLSRPEMPYRRLIMAILISPMIVPIIITATGLFFAYSAACVPQDSMVGSVLAPFLSHKGCLANSYLGIILAHAMLGIPFVIITVTATLIGFDQTLIRAAASLGASPTRIFFKVTMPLILPGIISGALFAFVTSFDEVVAVLYIASADQQTIPRQMWNGIREAISPAILSIATILVFVSIGLLVVVEMLRRRSERLRGVRPS
ncbi:ABC transporter permease [Aestuariivirga sp.]|jgi:putative spermidine/putrescine transport system permease protein|uniref:ABC transporter permease n=1 Tax=Aestuariivirga sp. TaxID=2650926 RepID=UPI0037834CDE